jgi:hypothetical protein
MRQLTIWKEKPPIRRTTVIPGLFLGLLAAAALAASAAAPAGAVTQSQLKPGWTCITVPGLTDQQHCARTRDLERFLNGEAKTMKMLVFDSSGETFLGTEINVRDDVFHDQPCPTDSTGEYTHLTDLGLPFDYWACHRFDSDHL